MSGVRVFSAVEYPKAYYGGMSDPEFWCIFPDSIHDVPPTLYVVNRWCTRDVTIVDDERPGWRGPDASRA